MTRRTVRTLFAIALSLLASVLASGVASASTWST